MAVPTDDVGYLNALIAVRNALAAEVQQATAYWSVNGPKPTYSLDGRSVQWDEWLRTRLDELKALNEMIVALDTPYEIHVRAWV